jgi:16S rRNA (guanine527-N7)-methyltransferase
MGQELVETVQQWSEDRAHTLPEGTLERLETLCELWNRYARSMNLTAATSESELSGHIVDGLDCLACASACGVGPTGRWLDVGSGGGFPGLVVAAASGFDVTLVEPRQKRAAFLELAARAIKRSSTGVFRARWGDSTWNEKVVGETLEGGRCVFRVASARAVFRPAEWLEKGMHVVHPGGVVLVHLSHVAVSPQPASVCAKMVGTHGVVTGHRVPEERT